MSIVAEELEIFILTYNRADMLKVAIQSCLDQTIKEISITVLDNASTDHTSEIASSFRQPNVRLLTSEKNTGGLGNIKRCQELCSKKYVMVFHDDDQLHPLYIEHAFAYIQANPDTNIVVSNASTIPAQSRPNLTQTPLHSALKIDQAHFAAALYLRNKIAFCSAIYRKESLKSLDFERIKVDYGKWGDRPVMIEATGNGVAINLTGPYVFTGRHDAQDTHLEQTQPEHTVWLNREKFFRDFLGENPSSFLGLCFCVLNHRRLKSGFKRRIKRGISFQNYLDHAFLIGAVTKKTWRFRWLAPRLIQHIFIFYSKHYFARRFGITMKKKRPL